MTEQIKESNNNEYYYLNNLDKKRIKDQIIITIKQSNNQKTIKNNKKGEVWNWNEVINNKIIIVVMKKRGVKLTSVSPNKIFNNH